MASISAESAPDAGLAGNETPVTMKRWGTDPCNMAVVAFACLFLAVSSSVSYSRWANFDYRTFDLAYYVQALWQLVHGRFELSLAGVPLLGNHVEPIVFLIAPIFVLLPHPMTFVLVQNAGLATMAPIAFNIGRRIGLTSISALLLALALLLTPATGYVALHEFHPEAFTAPLLLLMIYAHLRGSLPLHWAAFIAVLACKENMGLLLAAYSAVHLVLERKRPASELRAWFVGPLILSLLWFLVCSRVITPALNSGAIDYVALYDRLGTSAADILIKAVTEPSRIVTALLGSLTKGNLVWALLLPFLGLPLLRPRWLLIGVPVLLQHLLSWRSSEWQIYFHYSAPLLPLFWIALVQSVAGFGRSKLMTNSFRTAIPYLVLVACAVAQILLGPAGIIFSSVTEWSARKEERVRKRAFLEQISPSASVVAPLPYLSHLAMREKLYSLHYILKGLKTLSRVAYDPPRTTDFVLIDYDDDATFDAGAGYYHPAMKTVDGRIIPSSDQLLHQFLQRSAWTVNSSNELALFRKSDHWPDLRPPIPGPDVRCEINPQTTLTSISKSSDLLTEQGIEIRINWVFQEPRKALPWMRLKLTPVAGGRSLTIQKGLCAPEIPNGAHQESWRVVPGSRVPAGNYKVEAIFLDYTKLLWAEKSGPGNVPPFVDAIRIPLGELKVVSAISSSVH